jgi:hypothetical protein
MSLAAHPALVLNADFQPLSYFPLSLWPWQSAVKAILDDAVAAIAEYDAWARSPSTRIRLPYVVALRRYVPAPKRVVFTRFNVFLRDGFRCQYCGGKFAPADLTFDQCCRGFEVVKPPGRTSSRPAARATRERTSSS